MKRRKQWLLILTAVAALLLIICMMTGCGSKGGETLVKDVMIPNSQGTFTRAQAVLPSDYKERKIPVVTLSHGFHGTMNSAGAEALSHTLAENGIGAIRMDFSHYTAEDPDSAQTDQYTVETMVEDQVLCAKYMVDHFNGDSGRIGVFGRSLGGRAAMALANEKAGGIDCKGLILVAPAGNGDAFQRYMGGIEKWEAFKAEADRSGSVTHQGVVLTPEFFRSVEEYVPSENGYKFSRPVLVFYNTEDNVVLPSAAIECARSYEDHRIVEVTSAESPHGLEMGFEVSEIKDMIFDEIVKFYQETLK